MRGFATRLCGLVALASASVALAAAPPVPKLVIAISVDQFSADLFAQHRAGFTGGLKRLQSGVVFPSGYQSHAATETCPGHSTILSGMHPASTGMIGNSVWDPVTATMVYCLDDPAVTVANSTDRRGPARLRAATLGAWMKDANPASRVFAVAGKDRAALPMGGARADGAFWWNEKAGGYTTWVPEGAVAADRLKLVADFNARLLKTWRAAPPRWVAHDKSCAALAGTHRYGDTDIIHSVPPHVSWTPPKKGEDFGDDALFEAWFRASPEFDRVTLDLAADVIRTQKLGRGSAPDLLAIGLSATDYVGHRFGNQGPEMCDQMGWLDARLDTFFKGLDALKIPYVVVLTADHGSIDAAERVAERGIPAVRIDSGAIFNAINKALQADFKLDFKPLVGDGSQIMVTNFGDPDPVLRAQLTDATIAKLKARPEVVAVFTRAELLASKPPRGKSPDSWTLAERFAANSDADRSADISVAYKEFSTPFAVDSSRGPIIYIAGHGSPWDYDRRVPILFWWPAATGFEQPLAVETVDIAPTLAGVLGIKAPVVDGRCLDLDAGAGDSCKAK